jgi:hypothetical protein
MKLMIRNVARVMLVAAFAAGCASAQESTQERHVKDIRAEQTPDAIAASPLCQRTRETPRSSHHFRDVDPATLEPDMIGLMEKSDEVVLGSQMSDNITAISPSGQDAVHYYDVKVMRTWKGSHKIGDTLTFAIPSAVATCAQSPSDRLSLFTTITGGNDWKGLIGGPYILFLRHSQGDELELIPDFRLAGGDGLQGLFIVAPVLPNSEDQSCYGILAGSAEKCRAILETSQDPVSVRYLRDPLFKKYDKMPISSFLKEVQATADSLGYTPSSAITK